MLNDSKKSSLRADAKLEEVYLNYCRKNKVKVDISCVNDRGIKTGYIIGFDNCSLILEVNGSQELFYKTSVISISPRTEVDYIFNDQWREKRFGTRQAESYNYCYN